MLNLEITSVSKKPQTVSKAAAAVFVITGDDIRRMGAQTIPDALRMAPGIDVAQISASAWALTARGLNGRFANKLLVLVDGRTVFSPAFSGVFWDVQDTLLADVERIEVIRGPGGATWGANALHGVVNIIKSAAATQGGLLEVSSGTARLGLCRPGLGTVAASCFYPNPDNDLPRSNHIAGRSHGLEIAADWQASRQHRLQTSLTRFAMKIPATTVDVYTSGSSPTWSGSLRWSYTPSASMELDLALRQVGRLNNMAFGQGVPGYRQMDLRWAWRTAPSTQWELVARNLLGGKHLEFISESGATATSLVGASLNLGLRLQF